MNLIRSAMPCAALLLLAACSEGTEPAAGNNVLITELDQLDTVDGTISDDMTTLDGATQDSDNIMLMPDSGPAGADALGNGQ